MAERDAPAVWLSGVRHGYRKVVALDGVDLTLPAGRLSGLIGPDGVGKSTLLGLIAGVRQIQVQVPLGNAGAATFWTTQRFRPQARTWSQSLPDAL